MKKLNFKANFKKATAKKQVKEDLKALLAIPLYVGVATVLKLSGWAGMITAFGVTWGTGALLDIEAMRRAAWGIAGTHLAYSTLSGTLTNTIGTPWQMGGGGMNGLRGLRGMSGPRSLGSYNMTSLPDGNGSTIDVMARTADEVPIPGNNYSLNGFTDDGQFPGDVGIELSTKKEFTI